MKVFFSFLLVACVLATTACRGEDLSSLKQKESEALHQSDYSNLLTYATQAVQAGDTNAFLMRGVAYLKLKNFDRAITDFNHELSIHPDCTSYAARGNAYFKKGDPQKAIADLSEAIRLCPDEPRLYLNRSTILLAGLHQPLRAIFDLNYAASLAEFVPSASSELKWEIHRDLAVAHEQNGDLAKSYDHLTRSISLAPADEQGLLFLWRGVICAEMTNYAGEIKDYEKAMQVDTNLEAATDWLAWMLAACPDTQYRNGNRAEQLAKTACEATHWHRGEQLETYAAALAECGDFNGAVKWQNRAIYLGFKGRESAEKETRSRLVSYQNSQPMRIAFPTKGVLYFYWKKIVANE